MPSITQLKERIDLHDLAEKLDLERPDANGNYRSPHHDDKNPSLSIYDGGTKWKDHSADEGGSCIDLVMYVENITDTGEAMKRLHDIYGWELDKPDKPSSNRQRSKTEWFADLCLKEPTRCSDYLVKERKISPQVVQHCIDRRTLGFTDYTNAKHQPGELHYGGDAVAFIARNPHTKEAVAIDYRYFDPSLNGDLKTKSVGEKAGVLWVPDFYALKDAHTVVIVESAINVLSVLTAARKGWTAVAIRGTNNQEVDWRFLTGKRVVLGMDNDKPNDKGIRPGAKAAWRVHEELNALNIPACF